MVLFLVSQIFGQPASIQPVGDKIINQAKNRNSQQLHDRVNVDDDIGRQLARHKSKQDRLSITDNVVVTISKKL